jgi:tRNA(Ile)-lysidine synthase TilS/MesJ
MNAAFTPLHETAAAASEAGTVFTCSLCGCRFTHGGEVCSACPISRGCDLVRCPSCGFQFPRSSRAADYFGRLWKKWRREK